MPARSLADALAESTAGPLLARIAHTQRLSRTLADIVTPLAPDFDVNDPWACELKEGVLLLNARSSAQAAKLRQGIPGMLRCLHQTGAQVTEIRVKVQPARMSYPERANDLPQVPAREQIQGSSDAPSEPGAASPTAVAGLRNLAQSLIEGLPDSPLRRAAQRLQASLARPDRIRTGSGPRAPKR